MEHSHLLHQALLIFAVAGIIVPLLAKLKISNALAFLLVGVLIGPSGLNHFTDQFPALSYLTVSDIGWVHILAEIGVVLLLFMIGLELSIEKLLHLRKMVLGLGSAQILITTLLIALIAAQFDNTLQMALLIGASIALSSTATVIEILKEQRLLATKIGTTCFAILLMQDLAVVPILILQDQFAHASSGDSPNLFIALSLALLKATLTIALIFILGKKAIRPLLSQLSHQRDPHWFMPFILLLILGTAVLTQTAGLSLVLGAFLAGLLISETEYKHEVETIIAPLRSLFMGIFFLSIGMMIDLQAIADEPVWIPLSVMGIFAIKSCIILILALCFKLPLWQGIYCGLLLGQGGEFAFLIISLSLDAQMMSQQHAQFFFIVIALSMALSPLIAWGAKRWSQRYHQIKSQGTSSQTIADNTVLILGFGRIGQTIGDIANDYTIPYLAIDNDHSRVTHFAGLGYPIEFGDAKRLSFSHHIDFTRLHSIIITLDDFHTTDQTLKHIRKIAPNVPIFTRARDHQHVYDLRENGADFVVAETLEVSLQLAEKLLKEQNVNTENIASRLSALRYEETRF